METRIVAVEGQQLAALEQLEEQAWDFISQGKPVNTARAYRADWADFSAWCATHGLASLPATSKTIVLYLTDRATNSYQGPGPGGASKEYEPCSASTLGRRLAAITVCHELKNIPAPTKTKMVEVAWEAIRRVKGVAKQGKAPAVAETLRRMVAVQPPGMKGLRDRALLLLGFTGAFRRSELVGLNREDIEVTVEGIIVHLRRSKTDQAGEGKDKGIPYGHKDVCPVRALEAWIDAAGITSGPLFRSVNRHGQVSAGRLSSQAVALIVKEAAAECHLDAGRFAGHSLRSGFATSAAAAGRAQRDIMAQTGHKTDAGIAPYIRRGSLFLNNAAAGLL